ncbi:MAG: Glycosyl transferase family 2 [Lachnoclostridium sp.]
MKQSFIGNNISRITETVKDIKGKLFNKNNNYIECYEASESSQVKKTDTGRIPPFINFVTFNRMGLTIRNLNNLLDSDEDFELHIIDCNSKDNTWDFIQTLNDKRIKSKTRFTLNLGPIYPLNYSLTKRKPGQYFITVDSDTFIKTKNWIARFMEVFDAFPEVGLLGVVRDNPYPRYIPPVIARQKGDINYLQLKNATVGVDLDFVPGQLQCLRPELIEQIGYWSEENGYGDAELSPRVVHYTNFTAGYLTTVEIDMTQYIGCNVCQGRHLCKLSRSVNSCFSLSKTSNYNESFVRKHGWKYLETFKELAEGKRTAYCASVHDPESLKKYYYNHVWASENFDYYIKNSN